LSDPVIGIDFGTTYSAVAYINRHGLPEILTNSEGARTTPSVVYFEEGGSRIVGLAARNVALSDPERTVMCIKREMGNPSYRFNADGKEYLPESIAAIILRQLKADAEARLGTDVRRAVISVPAYFKDSQRTATITAGELAELEVVATINEPTAAAIAYGLGKGETNQTVVVYDFGGGTFDVTVLKIDKNEFTVLSTDGDSGLGGVDVDDRVADYLADQFSTNRGIDLRADPYTQLDLITRAEQAKRDLSTRQSVMITLSSGSDALRVDLDRDRLSGLIGDLVERTRVCTERALESAKLGWPQIDSVLLVGGSSRITAVRDMIRNASGKELGLDVNPDEAVACGAAVRATLTDVREAVGVATPAAGAETESSATAEVGIVVRDVATHSLGVRAFNEAGKPINSIILPRFTELPCERRRTYATRADNQRQIEVEILQGDDPDPFSPEVESIGRLVMGELPARPAGQVLLSLTLRYDVDGLVEVEAEELDAGRKVRQQLLRKSGELDAEVIEGLRRDLDALEESDLAGPTEEELEDPSSSEELPPEPLPTDGMEGDDGLPPRTNYYNFLGVDPSATVDELTTALTESEQFWSERRDEASDDDDRGVAEVALATLAEAKAALLDPDARAQFDRDLGIPGDSLEPDNGPEGKENT
jgi:molecular chaperone DnaK